MVIKSKEFNDVYFSVDGGMDETHYVFVQGNDLPGAWQGRDHYTIAETGFGTGLNFLTVWKLFEETATPDQKLHFISIEKYPLSKNEIWEGLSEWHGPLAPYLDRFLELYPIRVPGAHEIDVTNRVRLTLWIGDVVDVFPEWQGQVDSWFLDGFTPAKNPDMWGDLVFETMARMAHAETSYATFTAARAVRDGIEKHGFSVEKTKGFGRKRDMIRGKYTGHDVGHGQKPYPVPQKNIAIIGGGLAGCAAAWQLQQSGHKVTLYEAGDIIASGASAGRLGMVNPKLTAKPTPHSEYYTACFANALRDLKQFNDIDFEIHGSLHLNLDDDKDRRFKGYIENLGWNADHIQKRGKDLYYPDGASVCPYKLCNALVAHNVDVRLGHKVTNLDDVDADIVVVANGYAVDQFYPDLGVGSVRGQVSWVQVNDGPTENKCFGGYITPKTSEGFHVLGSSFEPWNTSCDVTDDNHQSNLDRYNTACDKALSMDDVVGGWAALRASSKDRFPIVGAMDDRVYLSVAHGSHGIISGLMAARILRSKIDNTMIPLSGAGMKALCPGRVRKR